MFAHTVVGHPAPPHRGAGNLPLRSQPALRSHKPDISCIEFKNEQRPAIRTARIMLRLRSPLKPHFDPSFRIAARATRFRTAINNLHSRRHQPHHPWENVLVKSIGTQRRVRRNRGITVSTRRDSPTPPDSTKVFNTLTAPTPPLARKIAARTAATSTLQIKVQKLPTLQRSSEIGQLVCRATFLRLEPKTKAQTSPQR